MKVIEGIPGYLWRHGCGPTAAGMIIGYWDGHGFPLLVPGDASTQTYEVDQTIATGDGAATHYSDYSLPIDDPDTDPEPLPDLSEPPPGDEHASDCLADFMRTSWSAAENYYGWSWLSDVDDGLLGFIEWGNAVYGADYTAEALNESWGVFTWEKFIAEIDANRPMVLLVDTNGDGQTDHFVTAIGWRDDSGYEEYACLDTWGPPGAVRWERFREISDQYDWGIHSATYFSIDSSVHYVPEGYATIQEAIDACVDGDEVVVNPGTYYETIDFSGKAIAVRSSGGAEVTFIDGTGHSGDVVRCDSGEGPETVLEGFTVTGAGDDAMQISESNPTVTDCVFSNNGDEGMYINDCNPTITRCVFSGNANSGMSCYGSPTVTDCIFSGNTWDGMSCDGSPTITDCIFSNNDDTGMVLWGGDVTVIGCSSIGNSRGLDAQISSGIIAFCEIRDNAGPWVAGAYIDGCSSSTIIANCLFSGNTAECDAGIQAYGVTMINCTVANNICTDDYAVAAGVDESVVANCIFWGTAGEECADLYAYWSWVVITHCDIGTAYDTWVYEEPTNMRADPCFVDPDAGDFRLGPGSRCADAGDNSVIPGEIETDLGGNPRFVDADGDGTATVDIGAYEYQETCYGVQIAVPGDYATVQAAIDAACVNDEIIVAPGTYDETITTRGKRITLRGSGGAEVTTLDGGGVGPVVTCRDWEGPDTVIDGFTITGGVAAEGGGMSIDRAHPTIQGCHLYQNTATGTAFDYGGGGGVHILSGNPTFSGCSFTENLAEQGGAISVEGSWEYEWIPSAPIITGCSFEGNTALTQDGGAILVPWLESASISNCVFVANSAADDGGGIYFGGGEAEPVTLSGCTFVGNTAASDGGAIRGYDHEFTLTNCEFAENSAYTGGGAQLTHSTGIDVEDCTFTGNSAVAGGGGLYTEESTITVSNCTFMQNSAVFGGGLHSFSEGAEESISVSDSTFSGNDGGYGGGLYAHGDSATTVSGCDFLENTAFRGGGLRCFLAILEVSDSTFQNNTAADAGGGISNLESFLAVGTSMFCGNEPEHTDGYFVDQGGNEFYDECPGDCPADVTGDGVVDVLDLLEVLGQWGGSGSADITGDGIVDVLDLLEVLGAWGAC